MEKIQSLIIIFCDFWKKNILFENHHFWFNVIHYKSHKDQKWTKNVILRCRFGQNNILLSKSPSPGNSLGKIFDSPFSPFPGEKNSHGEMEPLSNYIFVSPLFVCPSVCSLCTAKPVNLGGCNFTCSINSLVRRL